MPSQGRVGLTAAYEAQRELTDQAQNRARRDEVTGLARRWRFEEELERQVALTRRHGTPAALILIDVDALKAVNDTCGHAGDDRVLKHVADAMREGLRATDIAARIGGDEFAIILPEAGIDAAESVAERIIGSLRGTTAPDAPEISVSAGVAPVEGLLSPAQVLEHADAALYAAKRAGGDGHAVGDPTPDPQTL